MAENRLQNLLSSRLPKPVKKLLPVGGGCINQTYKIITDGGPFFCKLNSASKFPHLFKKEKQGLALIQKQNVIKVPGVFDCATSEETQLLILEWIEEGDKNQEFWKSFGRQLAALHQSHNDHFGLEEDNYMGSVKQSNNPRTSWNSFFIEERIEPLRKLCTHNLASKHLKQLEIFKQRMTGIFNDQKPALVHGDLWSGNFICNEHSQAVLIDPAVYFGHPSIDLGMTTLFGGFDKSFYEAYHYYSPLPSNYKEQWKACNLYPLLIHLYLFGRSYLHQVEETLQHFV